MMRTLIGVIAIAGVGLGGYYFLFSPEQNVPPAPIVENEQVPPATDEAVGDEAVNMFADGTYAIRTEESVVRWAGKKPLISGYINDGSLALSEGVITITEGVKTGTFTIDMNTLSVNSTPKKPGQESVLGDHLKGERWFDVATYPTATVTIDEVVAGENGQYAVDGTLTMKGQTNPITFPATITVDEMGVLRTEASFEIDRTLWGITAGSGSFFDNLADNVIDDMISLSFTVVAERQ